MKNEYRVAFAEVTEIIKLMPMELVKKIPVEFIKIIDEEKSKDYFPVIQEPIENLELKNETIVLLGIIYREFLCSEEEKEKLLEEEKQMYQELQNQVIENNNYSEILKNINQSKKITVEDKKCEYKEVQITVQEKKWYQKIFNLIKSRFK